jgi:hypothetical protein
MPRTIKGIAIVATSLILSGCAFPDKDGDFGAYVHNCQQYAYGKAYAFEHRDLAYKICKDAAKLWGDEVPAYVIRQSFTPKSQKMRLNTRQWPGHWEITKFTKYNPPNGGFFVSHSIYKPLHPHDTCSTS